MKKVLYLYSILLFLSSCAVNTSIGPEAFSDTYKEIGSSFKMPLTLMKVSNKYTQVRPVLKHVKAISIFTLDKDSKLFQKAKLDLYKTLNQSSIDNLLQINHEGKLINIVLYPQAKQRTALMVSTEDEDDLILIDVKMKRNKEQALVLITPLLTDEKLIKIVKEFAEDKTINIL